MNGFLRVAWGTAMCPIFFLLKSCKTCYFIGMASDTPEKQMSVPAFLDEGEFKLPEVEEKVLAFWDEHHIFEQSLEKKGRREEVRVL